MATPGTCPKYDNAEKQKLLDEGRYFNCGKPGYMSRACPCPKENPCENPARKAVCLPRIKEGGRDSDEDTLNEPGKEEP